MSLQKIFKKRVEEKKASVRFRQGWLYVETAKGFKKKYVRATLEGLNLCDNEKDKKNYELVMLGKQYIVEFVHPREKQQKCCFKVKTQMYTRYFAAEKEADMNAWLEFLQIEFPKLMGFAPQLDQTKSGKDLSELNTSPSKIEKSRSDSTILKHHQDEMRRRQSGVSKRPSIRTQLQMLPISSSFAVATGSFNINNVTTPGTTTPPLQLLSNFALMSNMETEMSEHEGETGMHESSIEDEYETGDVINDDGGDERGEQVHFAFDDVKPIETVFDLFQFTHDEEEEISSCSSEILRRDPRYRTPEEQAYVIALNDYQAKLKEHMERTSTRPVHNKATASILYTIPTEDLTPIEKKLVDSIDKHVTVLCRDTHYLPPELHQRVVDDSIAVFNKPKEKRTDKEQLYVDNISSISREIYSMELQHGLVSFPCLLHDL
jgi:hypothetical protein